MKQYPPPRRPSTRNPVTYQKHRHEVFWQITVPIAIGVILIVGTAIVVAVGASAEQISKLADVSLISLIIPAMIFTLIFIAINVAVIYGLVRLVVLLPFYSKVAQDFLIVVHFRVQKVGDVITEPFLRVHAWRASAGQLKRSLRRKPPVQ